MEMRASSSPLVRSVVAFAVALLASAGCATPTSVLELPACAGRVEVAGPGAHQRMGQQSVVLDHSWDLPGTVTKVTMKQRDGRVVEEEIVSVYPDLGRLLGAGACTFVGCGLVGLGGLELAGGASVGGPTILGVLGASSLGIGVVAGLTGWHPPSRAVITDASCVEIPPAVPSRR